MVSIPSGVNVSADVHFAEGWSSFRGSVRVSLQDDAGRRSLSRFDRVVFAGPARLGSVVPVGGSVAQMPDWCF